MKLNSYLIGQLEAFCARDPLAEKTLIVPSRQAGYNLTTWLATSGCSWINLKTETPASLAEGIALPHLQGLGKKMIARDEAFCLVYALLAQYLEKDDSTLLVSGPRLARTVYSTVVTLRLAGLRPDDVRHAALAGGKGKLISHILESYEATLEKESLCDETYLFIAATARVESGDKAPSSIAITDETPLPGVALRFVRCLQSSAREFVRIRHPDVGVDPPFRSTASTLPTDAPFTRENGAVHPAGLVRMTGLTKEDADRVEVRDGVGNESEVRGVFREIGRRGIALDEVEIVYTKTEPYVPLIHATAEMLGIPISFGDGVPLHLSRPGQAILGFFRWLAGDMDADRLTHMLRAGLVRFARKRGKEAVSVNRVAEILRIRRARKGKAEHLAAFDRERLRIASDRFAPRDEEQLRLKLEPVDRMKSAMSDLLSLVPGDAGVSVGQLARAGNRFLKRFFVVRSERDRPVLESIRDRLEGLYASSVRGQRNELAALLLDVLSNHRTGISVAREGHAYAVPLERAGYSGRSHLFVLGLDEQSFPGAAVEDPLLLDDDRLRLSDALSGARNRPSERVWHLLRVLASAPGVVTLVANRFDLIDGRERYASSIFAQCREDLVLEKPMRYSLEFDETEALTETDLWLAQRDRVGFADLVSDAYPHLALGTRAQTARRSSQVTRFDGFLGAETPELSLQGEQAVSPSRLETLASCPHKYFLKYVLKVRAPEEKDPEDHSWLDAREFGAVVHELLREFMEHLKETGERPRFEHHRETLDKMAEDKAFEIRERIPPETDLAFASTLRRLKKTAEIFLLADEQLSYEQAIGFEFAFGENDPDSRFPKPVRIDLGEGVAIQLRGTIDRVDRSDRGFSIWDYKTGSAFSFDRNDLFGSDKLQWALYAFAWRRMVAGLPNALDVWRSGYFFVGHRESGRAIWQPPPDEVEVGRFLAPLLRMTELGAFFHFQRSTGGSPCRFCDYRSVCETERRSQNDLGAAIEETEGLEEQLRALEQWISPSLK